MAFKYKPAYTRVKSFDGKDVIIANKIDKPKKKQNSKPTIIGPDDRNWVERKLNTPKNTGFLGDVFDVLSRGQYASANVAKKLVDKKRDSAKDILKASIDGLKGKARTSYNDVLKETGMKKGWKRSTLGFVGDVVLDPTTYLTLGAGTVGKVGAKGAVKLSDKVAQKALVTQGGKDLAKKIATNGLTHQKNAKYVDKAISTAEKSMETSKNRTELAEHIADLKTMKNYLVNPQLKGSEKALVRLSLPFMKDKTLIKRGKLLDNVLSGVDDAVRKTKVGQVLGKGFIPNFRKGETDKLAHQQFTNSLKQLRTDKDNNQRQAVKEIIDRVGKGLAGTEREALARLFEHPEELKLAPARVKQAYTKVETLFPEIRKAEIDAGIYVPEKSNYLPHYYEKPDNVPKKAGDGRVSERLNNQLQSSFNTLDEAETAGAKPIKDFYQIAARRLNDSKNSISTKQFVDKTLRQFGVKIKAGEQAPKGWGVHAVSTTETVNGKVRPKVEYYALPRQIADELNDLNKVDDGALEKVGRGYDKYFMAPWKALATAANPGFHVRNALSNQWQNYLDVGAKVFNPIEQAKALFLPVMKNVKVGDKTYSGKELIDVMKQQGVLNQGWIGKDLPTYIDKELKHGLKTLPGKTLDLINPLGQNFAGRKVGNAIENQAATFNFMQNLKKNGGDIKEAASHRDKFLFDYGDLTNFERKVMRRAVPFYTWMRKNIPLQAEQMIKQPGKYATIPKGINAIENQSDPVNETWLPEYMKGYIKTPLGSKDKPIYWNPNMPWQDLEKLNAKELPKTLIPSLTPPLKAAVELGMNKNFFFNDEIEKKRYNYDTEQIETLNVDPPDYLLALPDEYKEKLGLVQQTNKDGEIEWKMSPKSRYLLQQLPFIENASKGIKELKGLPSGETDKKGALHLLSWLGGIKGAEYDIEKQKSYTMSTQAREQGINQTTLDEMLSTLTKQGVSKDKAYDIILNTKSNKLVYKYPYGKGLESFKQSLNLLASQGVNPQKAYELLLNNKPLSTYKTDSGTTQEITYKTLLKLGMEPSSAYQMIVEEYPLTALQTKTLEALVDRGYTPEDAYGMLMEKRDRDRANRENEKPKPPKEWQIESAIRNLNK